MWIVGLVVGGALGAALGGWEGALVAGFLGWLAGLIVTSLQRKGKATAIEARFASLEQRVAGLEARLAEGTAPATERAWAPASAGVTEGDRTAASIVVTPAEAGAPSPVVPPADAAAPTPVGTPAEAGAQSPAVPEPRPPPRKPNPIVAWLTGGNTIARVGLLILFLGLAFLLKYAAEHSMLPVELRVAGVAAAGLALLVLGWRLREKRRAYAMGLQGGGVAVLYLTTFGALRLWQLLPPTAAFVLMALIAVFSGVLAVAQDAMALAVIGALGGFAAPILASTGQGSHVALFSYYLLLNLGVAGVALFKAWRPLNVVAFVFTFLVALAWGARSYRDELFASTEPFLVAHFLLFVAIAILFARSRPPKLKGFVDGTIVFGVPLAGFGLQAGMLHATEFGLAYSSIAIAAVYLVLAGILRKTRRENYALLAETFIALGVVFITLAIPLALDARWTSASWALEGAAIVWIGVRQGTPLARGFGLLLQAGAGLAFLLAYPTMDASRPIIGAPFVGGVLIAFAGLWTHRRMLGARLTLGRIQSALVSLIFAWGLGWWLLAGLSEIDRFLGAQALHAEIAFVAATAAVLGFLAVRWTWPHAGIAARLLFPALAFFTVAEAFDRHGFAHPAALAWVFAIGVQWMLLRHVPPKKPGFYWHMVHAGGVWVVAGIGALALHEAAVAGTAAHTAWSSASIVVVGALLLFVIASRAMDARWPVDENPQAYRITAPIGLAFAFIAWSFIVNGLRDGASDPLPYLPLLNAVDLAHILAGLSIVACAMAATRREETIHSPLRQPIGLAIGGGLVFFWLNAVLLRTLHHWAGIPYDINAMGRSVVAQASISIFWTVLAVGLMVFATRTGRRVLWVTGGVLMAIVVVKLFVVDLSHVGGMERIVSFIAVGVLMLAIGYFSPVPPRKVQETP